MPLLICSDQEDQEVFSVCVGWKLFLGVVVVGGVEILLIVTLLHNCVCVWEKEGEEV